jgi:hypothetical protein
VESGESDQVARAHAGYFRDFLASASAGSTALQGHGSFLPYADLVGNVRAALDWSFSNRGDPTIGLDLAAAAAPFFLELSLLTECYRRTQQALALDATSIARRQEMKLQAALGVSAMFTQANTEAVRAALTRSLQLAEELDDRNWQLWVLQVLQIFDTRAGNFQASLQAARRGEIVARVLDDPASTLNVKWALGIGHHMIGNQHKAVEFSESAMVENPGSPWPYTLHLGYDNRLFALVAFARGLWLTGWPDRAVAAAKYTISETERLQQPLSLSLAFVFTIPVFLWIGDWVAAEQMIDRFLDYTARHTLGPHHAVGIGFKGELLVRRGSRRCTRSIRAFLRLRLVAENPSIRRNCCA